MTSPTVQRAAVAATRRRHGTADDGLLHRPLVFIPRSHDDRDEAAWAAWNQRWEELVGAEERAISGYNVGAPLIQLDQDRQQPDRHVQPGPRGAGAAGRRSPAYRSPSSRSGATSGPVGRALRSARRLRRPRSPPDRHGDSPVLGVISRLARVRGRQHDRADRRVRHRLAGPDGAGDRAGGRRRAACCARSVGVAGSVDALESPEGIGGELEERIYDVVVVGDVLYECSPTAVYGAFRWVRDHLPPGASAWSRPGRGSGPTAGASAVTCRTPYAHVAFARDAVEEYFDGERLGAATGDEPNVPRDVLNAVPPGRPRDRGRADRGAHAAGVPRQTPGLRPGRAASARASARGFADPRTRSASSRSCGPC